MKPRRVYGRGEFPIAEQYVVPRPRNRLMLVGLLAAVIAVLAVWGATALLGSGAIIAGPLSAAHANFANQCGTCHLNGATVSNRKLAACPEGLANWAAVP